MPLIQFSIGTIQYTIILHFVIVCSAQMFCTLDWLGPPEFTRLYTVQEVLKLLSEVAAHIVRASALGLCGTGCLRFKPRPKHCS